jgi:diacylglycerol kinase (ATP)
MRRLINSFGYALKGLLIYFRSGGNVNIHLAATLLVLLSGFYFQINSRDWIVLFLCIFSVHAAEAFNTAIEQLMDFISPEHHPMAGKVKDLAAGAVLLVACGAALAGILIFRPYLVALV